MRGRVAKAVKRYRYVPHCWLGAVLVFGLSEELIVFWASSLNTETKSELRDGLQALMSLSLELCSLSLSPLPVPVFPT
jgi:hypothetical protein